MNEVFYSAIVVHNDGILINGMYKQDELSILTADVKYEIYGLYPNDKDLFDEAWATKMDLFRARNFSYTMEEILFRGATIHVSKYTLANFV